MGKKLKKLSSSNILKRKADTKQQLCHIFDWNAMNIDGVTLMEALIGTSNHDFNRDVGTILRRFELDNNVDRPENWNNFSKKIEKTVFNEKYDELSSLGYSFRMAVLMLAKLADCMDYIEKAELNPREENDDK